MCEPDPASIAAAIERLVAQPAEQGVTPDVQAAWKRDARMLLDGLEGVFGVFEAPGLAFAT